MRCDIHTNWSITRDGKCEKVFCDQKGESGCALVKRRKGLLTRFKRVRAERLELEKELVG